MGFVGTKTKCLFYNWAHYLFFLNYLFYFPRFLHKKYILCAAFITINLLISLVVLAKIQNYLHSFSGIHWSSFHFFNFLFLYYFLLFCREFTVRTRGCSPWGRTAPPWTRLSRQRPRCRGRGSCFFCQNVKKIMITITVYPLPVPVPSVLPWVHFIAETRVVRFRLGEAGGDAGAVELGKK